MGFSVNREFSYNKGKGILVVSDEFGTLREVEYQDNIEKIFIKEDEIEDLEKLRISLIAQEQEFNTKIEGLEKEVQKKQKIRRKKWLLRCIGYPALFGFLWWLRTIAISPISMPSFLVSSFILGTFIAAIDLANALEKGNSIFNILNCEKNIANLKRKINGVLCEKISLENLLSVKRKEYIKLSKEKEQKYIARRNEEIHKLDSREELEKQRAYLELMYKCGYNEELYRELYQEGQLNEELKDYTSADASIIFNYIETKENVRKLKKEEI